MCIGGALLVAVLGDTSAPAGVSMGQGSTRAKGPGTHGWEGDGHWASVGWGEDKVGSCLYPGGPQQPPGTTTLAQALTARSFPARHTGLGAQLARPLVPPIDQA